ncbi:tripartite-type tricarboxylate transporter receptor subunit TctC [Amorphus suaedae]
MRRFAAAAVGLALVGSLGAAQAQTFPDHPITIVNPYSAGGPADLIARTVGEKVSQILGQPVVVENRPGAATAIAASTVAQADPDGYTLLIAGSPTHVVTPAIQKVNYKGIEDFEPVAMVAIVPNVLVVSAKSDTKTLDDLVKKAKSGDGVVSFASVGVGSLPHLAAVFFQQSSDATLTHIPYGGAAPAVVDVLAGNVDMAFLNAPPLMPYIEDGELIPLGVASSKRSAKLPDLPTMEEQGFQGFEMSTWYGISAPAGTPKDVVAKLDAAIKEAVTSPDVAEKLTSRGAEVFYMPSDEFAAYLAKDSERMLGLIDKAGLKSN